MPSSAVVAPEPESTRARNVGFAVAAYPPVSAPAAAQPRQKLTVGNLVPPAPSSRTPSGEMMITTSSLGGSSRSTLLEKQTTGLASPSRRASMLQRQQTEHSLQKSIEAAKYVFEQKSLVSARPWYILHPHSRGVGMWDMTTSIALAYTAIFTPFEVSFLESVTSEGPWTIFTLNRIIDVIFIFDMGLQFVIMQQVVDFKKGVDVDSLWESRPSKLAARYMKMWFWIDLFSVLPSIFDILPAVQPAGETSETSQVKVLRVVRTLRLAKLVRLIRSSRVIERWETRIAIPYNLLTVVTLLIGMIYATHLLACIFALQTTFSFKAFSWYGSFGYCDWQAHLGSNVTLPLTEEQADAVPCAEVFELYLQSFYWALGLVLGFTQEPMRGPYPPVPNPERFTKLLRAILWAYVTARLIDVIVNANPEATRFRQSIDELNRFCSFNNLPKEMEIRLREYYIKRKTVSQAESRQNVAEGLSPMLQGEVAWQVNSGWLERIPFLNRDTAHGEADPEMQQLRVRVALALRPNVYAPNERPPSQRLYVIFNGLARYRGETLKKGDHWGEWEVLLEGAYTRRAPAKALNYLHVLTIDAEMIKSIAGDYPDAYAYIRRWTAWRSLSEFLLDKLRRRRRNMILTVKRWQRRFPRLFSKMRGFLKVVYLLLKDMPGSESAGGHKSYSHRGRLSHGRSPSSHNNVADSPRQGGGVAADVERLAAIKAQIEALLSEQANLATRFAEHATARQRAPMESPR